MLVVIEVGKETVLVVSTDESRLRRTIFIAEVNLKWFSVQKIELPIAVNVMQFGEKACEPNCSIANSMACRE